MRGIGTDEAALIRILGNRNHAEIAAIKAAYQTKFGKDLISAVNSELSGDFRKAMVGLLKEPRQYDSDVLHESMKGVGSDEFTIVTVLLGRTTEQKQQISTIFQRDHARSLESTIRSESSGDTQRFLLALLQPRASDATPLDETAARADAEKLYSAGEGKLGTDERTFIEIFTTRSWPHLKRTFAIYETIHKRHTMEAAVESEFSGTLKTGLRGVVVYARNPGEYYADIARRAMKGVGTDETMLSNVIIGNRDRLAEIKTAYSAKYGKSLHSAVEGETSGDFKKTLLSLIGH
jgi:annexin A7/11